jgi:phosphoglycolate phosphatase/putative hydrolase of the HAD superfamily
MRLCARVASPRALILDFDSTLYTNPAYASFQNEVLVERLAQERGESLEATKATLAALKAEAASAGRGATSLGNLFLALGIPIETSVRWREELIEPGLYLSADPILDAILAVLGSRYSLALVTNNPAMVGKKGLAALGVAGHFGVVVGLDDCLASKPDPAPFKLAASRLGQEPSSCISVGDRYDVDLAPAIALGMGAILVEGVADVYRLPEFLASAC